MLIGAIIGYILVSILIQGPILWLAGRMVVGEERAKFMDAVIITVSAVLANAIIGSFFGQSIGGLVQVIVYLALIVRYYETDWINAAIIAIVNTVLGWVISWGLIVIFGITAIF